MVKLIVSGEISHFINFAGSYLSIFFFSRSIYSLGYDFFIASARLHPSDFSISLSVVLAILPF